MLADEFARRCVGSGTYRKAYTKQIRCCEHIFLHHRLCSRTPTCHHQGSSICRPDRRHRWRCCLCKTLDRNTRWGPRRESVWAGLSVCSRALRWAAALGLAKAVGMVRPKAVGSVGWSAAALLGRAKAGPSGLRWLGWAWAPTDHTLCGGRWEGGVIGRYQVEKQLRWDVH